MVGSSWLQQVSNNHIPVLGGDLTGRYSANAACLWASLRLSSKRPVSGRTFGTPFGAEFAGLIETRGKYVERMGSESADGKPKVNSRSQVPVRNRERGRG